MKQSWNKLEVKMLLLGFQTNADNEKTPTFCIYKLQKSFL